MQRKETEMDSNTIGALIYFAVALVVAIISATIMRVKEVTWKFDIWDTLICVLFGIMWPIVIFIGVVYSISGFICDKFLKAKEGELR